jgi:membrane-associated HD superfamily phosphohydrolase
MKVLEKGAPVAAIVAALSTLACCVPLGFLGALGLASMSVWVQPLRPWLLAGAVVLLCLGFVQLYFRKSACNRRSRLSLVLFWIAVTVVVLVILFPQVIASVIAG